MSHPMSMESVLDQEAKEVLALLEGTTGRPRGSSSSVGGGSGPQNRAESPILPRSPVRSMLDVGPTKPHRPPSISSVGSNGSQSRSALQMGKVRSMLDIGEPSGLASAGSGTRSAHASPTVASHREAGLINSKHRSASDAASRPAEFGPRAPGFEKPSPYQFSGYLPTNPGGPVVPKRNTQGPSILGKKTASAMAEVMRGTDLGGFGGRDRGRNSAVADIGTSSTAKSRSPHSRLSLRSNSPHTHSGQDTSKFKLKDGRVLDMNSAYRRLSDGNLALAGGSLGAAAALGGKNRGKRANSDGYTPTDDRLQKDYTIMEGEDAVVDSSDDETHSSDEERQRGRKKDASDAEIKVMESKTLGMGRAAGPRTARSLMAAAEEERQEIASQQQQKYKIRSLLDTETPLPVPAGTKLKPGVRPNTSFDEISGFMTPITSDTEADLKEAKGAQKLPIRMTVITSTPATNRCIRSIYRGDFTKMQEEADENHRRVRKYLVATDLSEEAQHAMEWTIGTVLRDGDTLLAIYCVDEEVGINSTPDTSSDDKQLSDQASAIAASTNEQETPPLLFAAPEPSPRGSFRRSGSKSATSSPMGRERSKEEQERMRAVRTITEMITRLLRKTKLQVRVVVEVLHCKSPKHLICEVIDHLSPTLVILGSRGRSALKGVILGSFSNYLVTKSSVPVMVARKKLSKKVSSTFRRPIIRQANNLDNPHSVRTLAEAVIDRPAKNKKLEERNRA